MALANRQVAQRKRSGAGPFHRQGRITGTQVRALPRVAPTGTRLDRETLDRLREQAEQRGVFRRALDKLARNRAA